MPPTTKYPSAIYPLLIQEKEMLNLSGGMEEIGVPKIPDLG
jgi:hypothetical protein